VVAHRWSSLQCSSDSRIGVLVKQYFFLAGKWRNPPLKRYAGEPKYGGPQCQDTDSCRLSYTIPNGSRVLVGEVFGFGFDFGFWSWSFPSPGRGTFQNCFVSFS